MEFEALSDVVSVASLCAFSLVCMSVLFLRCKKTSEPSPDGAQSSDNTAQPTVIGNTGDHSEVSLETVVTEVEAAEVAQFEVVASSCVAKHAGCFAVLSLACGFSLENPVMLCVMAGFTLTSGIFVWHAYCREAQAPTGGGYKAPLMPLPSLLGILMNAILFARLPLEAVRNAAAVACLCLVLYFVHAGPRSRLEALSYGRLEELQDTGDVEVTI
eukprot:gnl/MRDRNA2_/MRDRNA2_209149_c0_seq1.p1 gnl/MRDRNA2_/MRDRNA2_209149_c0~~gnl/MRDRNA2_/MRDRNA2_209149_c0_seq1.p1  ORF type:complete len:231 (-),score=39.34 gnl/MRDRNA2_/MRDRNA2_209149_c0_seq1:16-660(-)